MGVSKNRGTPKSSILIGFCIINHPFWGNIWLSLETIGPVLHWPKTHPKVSVWVKKSFWLRIQGMMR